MRSCRPRRHRSLTAPITDGFRHMRAKNIGAASKIGDGARHAQNAVHRTRRELQKVDRIFQHCLIFAGEPTHGVCARLIVVRVAATGALLLNFTRTDDACRRRRHVLSITQEEAALWPGVNVWTVHNWETGQLKPAIQFIPALVGFLGYDPEPADTGTLAGRLVAAP